MNEPITLFFIKAKVVERRSFINSSKKAGDLLCMVVPTHFIDQGPSANTSLASFFLPIIFLPTISHDRTMKAVTLTTTSTTRSPSS
jgi:hypothetical protein